MTVYLRTYHHMETNDPEALADSKRTAKICNNVVRECMRMLKAQGINVQLAYYGDEQLVEFDEECIKIQYKPHFPYNHVSIDGDLYLSTKIVTDYKMKVPMRKERNFDYMTVDSVLKSYTQYGITYECNGDFTSIHKEVEE